MEQFVRLNHDNITFSGTATLVQFKVENVSAGAKADKSGVPNLFLFSRIPPSEKQKTCVPLFGSDKACPVKI
jgi:hypothetical protein